MPNRKDSMKHHATFYMSQDTLDLLEGAWLEIRSKSKSPRLNKSVLVEIAIKTMCDNIRHTGLGNELVEAIKKSKE